MSILRMREPGLGANQAKQYTRPRFATGIHVRAEIGAENWGSRIEDCARMIWLGAWDDFRYWLISAGT